MKKILRYLGVFGIFPVVMVNGLRGIWYYIASYLLLQRQAKGWPIKIPNSMSYPCLNDRFDKSGVASGHYFHQDLYVASCIFKDNPKRHIDIGSRIDGFVAHVASFRMIEVFDIRSLKSTHGNIVFNQLDLSEELPDKYVACTDSLSCLHAIEHIGLGRYGDKVDYMGHISALLNLVKMLTSHGKLYISMPIGPLRIEFNAHRVFSVEYLVSILSDANLKVLKSSLVDDKGDFHNEVSLNKGMLNNFGCSYGCIVLECMKK